MPDDPATDPELQHGHDRLECYAKDPDRDAKYPELAWLLVQATPSSPGASPTQAELTSLARVVEYFFGPRHVLTEPQLREAWTLAPGTSGRLASYLATVVPAVRRGVSVRRAAIVWHLRRLPRVRFAHAGDPDEEWARRFTRGPAWP